MDIKDMSVFEFPWGSNISQWIDSAGLSFTFTQKQKKGKIKPTEVEDMTIRLGPLTIRTHILPSATKLANVWIALDIVKEMMGQVNFNSPHIPTI